MTGQPTKQAIAVSRAACFLSLTLICARGLPQGVVGPRMHVIINPGDASYAISVDGLDFQVLRSQISAKVNGQWLQSSAYPQHRVTQVSAAENKNNVKEWSVVFSNSPNAA